MNEPISINIFLREDDEPFSRYYRTEDIHLNLELEEYILSYLYSGRKTEVEILVSGENEFENDLLENAILNSFFDRLKTTKHIYERNIIKAIVLYVIGVIIAMFYLWMSASNIYIAGLLSVICWVFAWSATETYFFDNHQLKMEMIKYKNVINANILTGGDIRNKI